MKERLENIWDNIKIYFPFILVILFLIGSAVGCFYNCNKQTKKQNAIDGGVKVSATIVNIDAYHLTSTLIVSTETRYETIYEYIDSDGTKYDGVASSGFKTKEEAEKYLGTKVDIYIDGKGNSIIAGKTTSFTAWLVMGIILTIIGLGFIAFVIWSKIPYRHNQNNNANEEIIIESGANEYKNRKEEITTDITIEKEDERT